MGIGVGVGGDFSERNIFVRYYELPSGSSSTFVEHDEKPVRNPIYAENGRTPRRDIKNDNLRGDDTPEIRRESTARQHRREIICVRRSNVFR